MCIWMGPASTSARDGHRLHQSHCSVGPSSSISAIASFTFSRWISSSIPAGRSCFDFGSFIPSVTLVIASARRLKVRGCPAKRVGSESCTAVADLAHEAGASVLALSMAEATTQASLAEVADATRHVLEYGAALGLGMVVYGLPFCLLGEHVDKLSPTPPVSPVDGDGRPVWGTRLTQPPRCRACELSNRCPGVSEVALEREGEAKLTPVAGRPTTDALPTLFERWLMAGGPPRMERSS